MDEIKKLCIICIGFCLVLITPVAAQEKIRVVTTITILEDLVKEIGGEKVEVTSIVTGLENPHTYAPKVSDIKAVSDADVFVKMGIPGLEPWAESLLESAGNKDILIVTATNGIKVRFDETIGRDNPHVWMDPENVKKMVENIADALILKDPGRKSYYENRKDEYMEKLDELEEKIKEKTSEYRGTRVVEVHPAFMYLLERIGFERVATIEQTEGGEPSAKHIAEVENAIMKKNVKLIVDMPQLSSPIVHQISEDTGVNIVYLTPLIGPFGTDSYIEMIEYDVEKIVEALEKQKRRETFGFEGITTVVGLLVAVVLWRGINERKESKDTK
ncbi:MAG: metal ABC transporter substrate-binding protein [Candidatus Syntropharchaeia archaeon]